MLNVRKLHDELRYITIYPEKWDQGNWIRPESYDHPELNENNEDTPPTACGTVGCLAGNVALRAGWKPNWEFNSFSHTWDINNVTSPITGGVGSVSGVARTELGLTHRQAETLFNGDNTLRGLWAIAERITCGEISEYDFDRATREYELRVAKEREEDRKKAIAELQQKVQEFELSAQDLFEVANEATPSSGRATKETTKEGDSLVDSEGRTYSVGDSNPWGGGLKIWNDTTGTWGSAAYWENSYDTQLFHDRA